MSDQLASLTLGDAGAAAILERAPEGAPGIEVAGFTTLAEEHAAACAWRSRPRSGSGRRCTATPGALQEVGIEDTVPMLREALDQAGLGFDEIDYFIPHQTSARAIEKGVKEFSERMGGAPKHVVVTVDEFGNTSSTTHFVALWKYLREGRFAKDDRIMLLSITSAWRSGWSYSRSMSWWGMGTIIEASATSVAHQRSMSPGSLELADTAARCVPGPRAPVGRRARPADQRGRLPRPHPQRTGVRGLDPGGHRREPEPAARREPRRTVSFDVYNGACGLLTGIQLVDGMLASGTAKLGMVVASDIDPEPDVSRGFSFPAVGGAVLLSADDSRAGFTAFQSATFPEYAELFQSYASWREDAARGLAQHGRDPPSSPSKSPRTTPAERSTAPRRPRAT